VIKSFKLSTKTETGCSHPVQRSLFIAHNMNNCKFTLFTFNYFYIIYFIIAANYYLTYFNLNL